MVDNDDDDTPKGESTGDFDRQDDDYVMESESLQLFSQSELHDVVRDLSFSKESSELLGLKKRTSSFQEQKFFSYRTRESKLLPYFDDKGSFVYCSNIPDLFNEMGIV